MGRVYIVVGVRDLCGFSVSNGMFFPAANVRLPVPAGNAVGQIHLGAFCMIDKDILKQLLVGHKATRIKQ